ncbi:uncharacterized protein LOC122672203 [Telopea speciosissima]|uniref:uncharacterized protein LOC122672203 n=1 Tax=Telopea speciosissima TaxID=54955 RepID=UPI001CC7CDEF|nr:uncharacterized protein LOC122672203 [Telopea speciosissima]
MADSKPPTDNFNVQITTIKLNGASNYVLWSQAFEVYVTARRKMSYLAMTPPDPTDDKYDDWKFFSFNQEGKSIGEYYSSLKRMWEELNVYQPISTDASVIKSQRSEFLRVVSLSVVKSDPTLVSKDNSALFISTGGHGRGGGTSSRGCGSGSGCGAGSGGRGTGSHLAGSFSGDSGSRWCSHCGRPNHTIYKCWLKHGKPQWAREQFANAAVSDGAVDSVHPPDTTHGSSTGSGSSSNDLVSQLLQRVQKLEASSSTSTAVLAHPGTSTACFASSSSPWVIDSGASSYMTGKPNLCSSFTQSAVPSRISIADGSFIPVTGHEDIPLSSDLSLSDVLHVPKLPPNLLSISQLTKTLNCSITFHPSHCVIQDLATKMTIGGGHEKGDLYYFDLASTSTAAVATSSGVSPLHWHYRLGHPSLSMLRHLVPSCKSISRI